MCIPSLYTYTYVYTYVYIYMYRYVCVHIYTYVYLSIYLCIYICTHTHVTICPQLPRPEPPVPSPAPARRGPGGSCRRPLGSQGFVPAQGPSSLKSWGGPLFHSKGPFKRYTEDLGPYKGYIRPCFVSTLALGFPIGHYGPLVWALR